MKFRPYSEPLTMRPILHSALTYLPTIQLSELRFFFVFEIAPFFAPGSGAPQRLSMSVQPKIPMLQFWKMVLEIVLFLPLR